MSEDDDVDSENPRPKGHYPRFADNEWHYVPDELAQTISLGPAGDGEKGQGWVLTYTPERRNKDDHEKVLVGLTPRALHELYIETKNLSTDQRTHGHSAECDLCGKQVDLDKVIPNPRGEPCHKHCWAEYTGAPEWFADHV
ncbi:hypothetical protein [Halapricum desulfuricans]|uniref:Uncharacterized protein n=1 Tax=Halapricum desulfuricans TaxID=2841257 RepID=A0A897NKG2_9EURY|nr:hypothetical protein [Halapricum desulfuricans]QSG09487.1 Uncharacterized protein HSR122_2103 [Halapricum desulfuricans]QSG11443.1 Uncharacterized protein HSBGL_1016 [Halapricum desulfuricans]